MSYTVNTAFDKFMKEVVNLDPTIVSEARSSRDNLLENIKEFVLPLSKRKGPGTFF